MTRQLDDIDRTILRAVTADGRQTVRALARTVGLSEPSVRDRLQRLERDGVITGYHADLDPVSVDAGTAAFIALRFEPGEAAKAVVNERLEREACVLEVHEVAGEDCYLLKVRVPGTGELAEALDRIRAIPPVISTNTTIVLRTVVERPLGVDAACPE
ncbi:Lrp/AsnC family transcriptional regulator [Saccharopolyspora sp. WRP15-2]|uniref:Lrp/AsnC family transcriptional regulator n=1 Tax=Saccharopolyspora oryzae TaxID=2997343 RepID=A0ABT4UZH5_9PSEU|nr:Lrp/AsnC family transcriptional regulator [Saccharopolyspora oryzae]MDA3626462.1 Lrp/AsnC family transcriptional regulator [Saccharopolyspora oryzae]